VPANGKVQALSPTSVILAEDDVLLRARLTSLLERADFEVVGQAGGTQRSSYPASAHSLPISSSLTSACHQRIPRKGSNAARVIREELPGIGILVLSAHVEVEHAVELLVSGDRIGFVEESRLRR
jgi:DNA-binding NarL/FixJ family response regulator